MSKRKILALALTVAMIAILAVGGSLAYFTDKDTATNVMAIGNVDIDVREWQWNTEKNAWEEFENNSMKLYPIENAQGIDLWNKLVQTKNVSTTEKAYIRTIIAIEDWFVGEEDVLGLHWGYYDDKVNVETYADLKIDGQEYDVLVFTNKTEEAYAATKNQDTIYSVWLDEDLTQEQIKKYFGDEVEILVLGQGIQATGLTHEQAMTELGAINSKNLSDWFDTTSIKGNVVTE